MENVRTVNQRSPGQPCARAGREPPRPALRLGLVLLAFLLLAAGAYTYWRGFPEYLPVLLAAFGLSVAEELVGQVGGAEYEISPLWLCNKGDCRDLSRLRRARLDWSKRAWYGGWLPALKLEFGAEEWVLPLSLPGWDALWDCLRELRPELDLPDWRRVGALRKAIARFRYSGVALPPSVEVVSVWATGRWLVSLVVAWLLSKVRLFGLSPRQSTAATVLVIAAVLHSERMVDWVWPPRITKAPWLGDEPASDD